MSGPIQTDPEEHPDYPKECSRELANICELCAGHGAFNVTAPEKFKGLLDDISSDYNGPFPGTVTGIACACNWWSWAEFRPSRQQYAQGYFNVSAVVLGGASDQQWFNVLGNSTEKGFSDHHLEKWAAKLGLSMDGIV